MADQASIVAEPLLTSDAAQSSSRRGKLCKMLLALFIGLGFLVFLSRVPGTTIGGQETPVNLALRLMQPAKARHAQIVQPPRAQIPGRFVQPLMTKSLGASFNQEPTQVWRAFRPLQQQARAFKSEPAIRGEFGDDFGGGDEQWGAGDDGGEQTGVLARWLEEKGFGFLKPNDGGEDIFVHVSGLSDGDGSLQEGDKVVYYKEFNDRRGKYQAVDVKMAPGFDRPEAGQPETGMVARWNTERGFGFVRPNDGGEDVFAHVSDLVDGDGSVMEGDEVTFAKKFNSRRGTYQAAEVKVAPGFVRTSPPPPEPMPDFGMDWNEGEGEGESGGADAGGSGEAP